KDSTKQRVQYAGRRETAADAMPDAGGSVALPVAPEGHVDAREGATRDRNSSPGSGNVGGVRAGRSAGAGECGGSGRADPRTALAPDRAGGILEVLPAPGARAVRAGAC